MSPFYILGVDEGTTGTTALVFNENQEIVGRAYREFRQYYPTPGWVEHDAEEIFESTIDVARKAIANAGLTSHQILAMGITNQRETTVVWDRETSKPIAPAIVWQCRRTAGECSTLKRKGFEKEVRKRTGLLLDPYFSATKVAWILDHTRGGRKGAEKGKLAFGTIDSWLIWKFTKGQTHATDFTNASRTSLFDIHQKKWSDVLLKKFRIPSSLLPKVFPSSYRFGDTHPEIFGSPIPILGVAGDQQAALFGHYATAPGQAKCTFGTGAFALAYLGKKPVQSKSGLLTTLVCDAEGRPAYGLEGSIFMAGAIVQWLRDELRMITSASETESIARSVSDCGGVTLVPAFVGLGAPYWDADARAAIVGMTRGSSRAHVVRAALEAIAFQTHDLVRAMAKDMKKGLKELRVDGGATANGFLLEFMSNLLGIPVLRAPMVEMTAFGAARLAAVFLGKWKSPTSAEAAWTRFSPKSSTQGRKLLEQRWDQAVRKVLSS